VKITSERPKKGYVAGIRTGGRQPAKGRSLKGRKTPQKVKFRFISLYRLDKSTKYLHLGPLLNVTSCEWMRQKSHETFRPHEALLFVRLRFSGTARGGAEVVTYTQLDPTRFKGFGKDLKL